MEDFIAVGYFLVLAAFGSLVLRNFMGGVKQGLKSSAGIPPLKDGAAGPDTGLDGNAEQLLLLFSKRKRLVKRAVTGLLVIGVWLICAGSFHDSLDARQVVGYWICKGAEECAIQTADSIKPILELSLWSSAVVFVVLYLAALRKWIKLVVLTGKVRNGKAEIALDSQPDTRSFLTSRIVVLGVTGLFLLGFVLFHFFSKSAGSRTASARGGSQPQGPRIETVGSDGFWLHEIGANAASLGEVKVLLDNQGKAYMEVKGTAVLLEENAFRSAFPNNVLIVKRINVDQFQNLVQVSPQNLDVQLVTALCKQRIPVMTFTDLGLTYADDLSLSEACAFVGGESSLQMLAVRPTATESLNTAMQCNEQNPGMPPINADLAADGNTFTISYGGCETAVGDNDGFVIIRRDAAPTACVIGIPITEHLYYMKVDPTATGGSALHIKGEHRDDDVFDSVIQVKGGRFVVSNAKGLSELHCE